MTTNELLYSEQFDQAPWAQADVLSTDVVSPPEGLLHSAFVSEATVGHNFIAQEVTKSIVPGDSHTLSFYLRLTGANQGDGTVNIRLARIGGDFEIGDTSFVLTADWLRYSTSIVWTKAHDGYFALVRRLSGGAEEIHISGAQCQSGIMMTPYIYTASTPSSDENVMKYRTLRRRRR